MRLDKFDRITDRNQKKDQSSWNNQKKMKLIQDIKLIEIIQIFN